MGNLAGEKLVGIGEGFWHISTCLTFNRNFKLKITKIRLQPLLAECQNGLVLPQDSVKISVLIIL